MVIVSRKFKNPLRINLTARMYIVSGTLYNLMINDPFGIDHAQNGCRVDLQSLLRTDVEVCAVTLNLCNISEISS